MTSLLGSTPQPGYQSMGSSSSSSSSTVVEHHVTFSRHEDQVVYVPGNAPGTPKKHNAHKGHQQAVTKKIGLAPLVVLIFYSVSGGPFGIEDIVRAGGPRYALMGFALLLVWAIPEALITAELSTAMPEASGSVAWVERAFGPFWAFQKGEVAEDAT